MHLVADVGVEVVATSGGQLMVAKWRDQSVSGNDLLPVSAPVQVDPRPTLQPGVLGGHSFVAFDGVNDGLMRGGFKGLPTAARDRTVLFVVRYRSAGWGGFAWGEVRCYAAFGPTVSVSRGELFVEDFCSALPAQSGNVGTGTGWLVQTVVVRNGRLYHYRNDRLIQEKPATWIEGNPNIPDRIMLGQEISGHSKVAMDVAELAIYDRALPDAERLALLHTMVNKYGAGLGIELQPDSAASRQSSSDLHG